MITLRQLVKSERALAAITAEECHLISKVIGLIVSLTNHWLFKHFIPKDIREKSLSLTMLSAILDRMPHDTSSLTTQIQEAMDKDKSHAR